MTLLVINTIVYVSPSHTLYVSPSHTLYVSPSHTLYLAQKIFSFFLQHSIPVAPKGSGTIFQGIRRYLSLTATSKFIYFLIKLIMFFYK